MKSRGARSGAYTGDVFNIGPMEFIVLGLVAILVFGPERLPQLARDAAQMIKALREVAQGARTQLRNELGPEFADVDLRNLNPRTAIKKALLGDELDLSILDPKATMRELAADVAALDKEPAPSLTKSPAPAVPEPPLSLTKAAPQAEPTRGSVLDADIT